jgi:hypothetical protein
MTLSGTSKGPTFISAKKGTETLAPTKMNWDTLRKQGSQRLDIRAALLLARPRVLDSFLCEDDEVFVRAFWSC